MGITTDGSASSPDGGGVQWVECYTRLRRAILDGVYSPGTKLVERQICAKYGVSRSSLRTSLHHLAAEELIELRPGMGATVAKVSVEDALQALDVREVLEGMAARLATERISEEQIVEMDRTCEQMKAALDRHDYMQYVGLTREFHQQLLQASGNNFLARAVEAARVKMIQYSTAIGLTGHIREMHRGHELILEAMKQRDPDLAERRAREHIVLLKQLIRQMNSIID